MLFVLLTSESIRRAKTGSDTLSTPQTTMPQSSLSSRYGPWAVITGASSGIGAEFARQLAARGFKIVLTARREDRLKALSTEIKFKHSTETRIIPADLSTLTGIQAVLDGAKDLDVGILVNNAGIPSSGAFLGKDIETYHNLIAVNVTAVMALAHGFGRRLRKRDQSAILFVSSMLSDPAPYFAPYSPSKSFISSLSLCLREELKEDGVDVMSLEPGFVKTEMSVEASDDLDISKFKTGILETDDCVKQALQGLASRKATVMPGFSNRVMKFMTNLLPRGMRIKLWANLARGALSPELLKVE